MLFFLFFAAAYAVEITPEVTSKFSDFQHKYNKQYATDTEFVHRLSVFADNLVMVAKQNADHVAIGGEEVFGVTKFMDLTPEEFKSTYLLSTPANVPDELRVQPDDIPNADTIDWVAKGATTPVKDQGQCGSCWAFSAVDAIESYGFLNGSYKLQELSSQQVNACDKTDGGCNGGDTITAYEYVQKAGGIETEASYPYTSGGGRTGLCKFKAANVAVKIAGYVTIKADEDAVHTATNSGPLSICVAANSFQTYNSGVLKRCPGEVDHCVQIVGYDDTFKTPYWKVRNSWAADWGENGYIRLEQGKNICKIKSEATFPTFS